MHKLQLVHHHHLVEAIHQVEEVTHLAEDMVEAEAEAGKKNINQEEQKWEFF